MANTTISPDMNLPIPTVSTDPGPDWGTNVVACLNAIDSHDHSPGQGVQVNPAGLNINTDLTMQSNNLTMVRTVRFVTQASPLSAGADIGCLYESGVDLYFNDGNGNQVRITTNGLVNAGAGSITGLPSGTASVSFAAGTYTFQSATNTPATMNVGPLVIGAAIANSKTVTIAPSNTLAANYVMTLPAALPASTSLFTVDASGNIDTTTAPTLSGGTLNGTYAGNPQFSGLIGIANGSVGSPSVAFTSEPGLGIWRNTSGGVSFASGGIESAQIGGVQALFLAGSASQPGISYLADTDTGMYFDSSNQLGFAANGTPIAKINTAGIKLIDGTEAAPSFTFIGDTNTGMYLDSADALGFSAGGAESFYIDGSGARVPASSSVSNPPLSFFGDPDTGIMHPGTNQFGITTGGTQRIQLDSSGLQSDSFGTITGVVQGIKWKIFSGTLAGAATLPLTSPGTIVLGVTGMTTQNGSANYGVMGYTNNGETPSTVQSIWFRIDALAANGVTIANYDTNSTNSYRVVMYYQ